MLFLLLSCVFVFVGALGVYLALRPRRTPLAYDIIVVAAVCAAPFILLAFPHLLIGRHDYESMQWLPVLIPWWTALFWPFAFALAAAVRYLLFHERHDSTRTEEPRERI